MKNIVVLVSGGGTNLQALIDAQESGIIKNGKITCVISSKADAYALERAKKHGIKTRVLVRKDYPDVVEYSKDILKAFNECKYRCQIGDINISPERITRTGTDEIAGLEDANEISASFTATFFETVDGATSTEGLVVITSDDSDGSGALADRAHAYE